MASSAARTIANRRNAALSTGPRTEEGKAASRGNAVKHGLSSLVVVPAEEAGEVARRIAALGESLAPEGDALTMILARQAAFLSVQLERGFRYDSAMATERARTAEADQEEARRTAADELLSYLGAEPVTHHRRLMATAEGVDLVIGKIEELAGVGRPGGLQWETMHGIVFDIFTGRRSGTTPGSRCGALSELIERDDVKGLDPAEIAGMDRPTRLAWALGEVHALVDAELARLRAHRATLEPGVPASSRAQAPDRALVAFDKDAQLARRYQDAAARALIKVVAQIRTRRRDVARRPGPIAVSRARVEAETAPDLPAAPAGLASFCALLDTPGDVAAFTVGKPPAPLADPAPPARDRRKPHRHSP